jgi:hypothetical protein
LSRPTKEREEQRSRTVRSGSGFPSHDSLPNR